MCCHASLRLGQREAGIDRGPARPVLDQPQIDMVRARTAAASCSHKTPGAIGMTSPGAGAVRDRKLQRSVHIDPVYLLLSENRARLEPCKSGGTSGKPAGQHCAARRTGAFKEREETNARLQCTRPLGGDGGERHGGDLAPARDADRARHAARRRQRGRCGDRGGGDAMRRRAGKHRDRRRLLCPLFEKRRACRSR